METRTPLVPVLAVALSIGVLVAFTLFLGVWEGEERWVEALFAREGWVGLKEVDAGLRALWVVGVAVLFAAVGAQRGVAAGARCLFLLAATALLLSFSCVLAMRGWSFEPGSAMAAGLLGFATGWLMRRGMARAAAVREQEVAIDARD
jgi:hypothetical protein